MTGHLDNADLTRLNRDGVMEFTSEQGLALFDAASGLDAALLVPARLDLSGLHLHAQAGKLAPLMHRLVKTSVRPVRNAAGATSKAASDLKQRLAAAQGSERERLLVDLIRVHIAAVLGYESPGEIEAGRSFRDLGFDSLTGIELRNRLNAATGLRLPSTLVFDQPTPAGLAGHLRAKLLEDGLSPAAPPIHAELDRLEAALALISHEDAEGPRIVSRLRSILTNWSGRHRDTGEEAIIDNLDAASDDEMFEFIGKQFGIS
jgi:pimaricinolide synthase PimS1